MSCLVVVILCERKRCRTENYCRCQDKFSHTRYPSSLKSGFQFAKRNDARPLSSDLASHALRSYGALSKNDANTNAEVVLRCISETRRVVVELDRAKVHAWAKANVHAAADDASETCLAFFKAGEARQAGHGCFGAATREACHEVRERLELSLLAVVLNLDASKKLVEVGINVGSHTAEAVGE